MGLLEKMNSFLSGSVLPVMLIGVGLYFAFKLRFFYILHPVKFFKSLISGGKGCENSPFKALTVALAGTLGVGNISGVATAISAGGAGAVFWMWISAFAAMSVKYVEVALAVKYRKIRVIDGKTEYYGGAPAYIKEGLSIYIGKKNAGIIAFLFSVLLISNSLITGNIVQVNAAASSFSKIPGVIIGIVFALFLVIVTSGGMRRVGDFTSFVIPVLSVVYLLLSCAIIFSNIDYVPLVFKKIFSKAFEFRSVVGGVSGYAAWRAVRFGVTRGVFSNEAGCGTAPTAHASADAKSPHDQGCFGIFEVFCDTVVLCTVTALVILISEPLPYDGIPLVAKAYGGFLGKSGEIFIFTSVVIFALATVICQSYYGIEAMSYIFDSKKAKRIYLIFASVCSVVGAVMSSVFMWQIADLQISVMTILNTLVIFVISDEIFLKKK